MSVSSSVRLSVPSIYSTAAAACNRFAAERLAGRRYRSIAAGALRAPCSRRRRSAANAGSVTLTVDGGGWTQTCCISCGTVLWQLEASVKTQICPCICLSVTSSCFTKTADICLSLCKQLRVIIWRQLCWWNSNEVTARGAPNTRGCRKNYTTFVN